MTTIRAAVRLEGRGWTELVTYAGTEYLRLFFQTHGPTVGVPPVLITPAVFVPGASAVWVPLAWARIIRRLVERAGRRFDHRRVHVVELAVLRAVARAGLTPAAWELLLVSAATDTPPGEGTDPALVVLRAAVANDPA